GPIAEGGLRQRSANGVETARAHGVDGGAGPVETHGGPLAQRLEKRPITTTDVEEPGESAGRPLLTDDSSDESHMVDQHEPSIDLQQPVEDAASRARTHPVRLRVVGR